MPWLVGSRVRYCVQIVGPNCGGPHRHFDYRLVNSRGMTQRDEYKGLEFLKEITKAIEKFLEHLSSSALKFCLVRKLASIFIDDEVGLESSCLKNF